MNEACKEGTPYDWSPELEIRPGVFKQKTSQGQTYHIVRCFKCLIPYPPIIMLVYPLWSQLSPKDGMLCNLCMEDMLGRELQIEDLHPKAGCSNYWRRVFERRDAAKRKRHGRTAEEDLRTGEEDPQEQLGDIH